MIMGETLVRRSGEQSASKLMRSVKPGCIVDCIGRPASAAAAAAPPGARAGMLEFAAVSVTVVLAGAVSARGGSVPLQTLSDLANPLSTVNAAARAPGGPGFQPTLRRSLRANGTGRDEVDVYKCPLPAQDIVLVRHGIRLGSRRACSAVGHWCSAFRSLHQGTAATDDAVGRHRGVVWVFGRAMTWPGHPTQQTCFVRLPSRLCGPYATRLEQAAAGCCAVCGARGAGWRDASAGLAPQFRLSLSRTLPGRPCQVHRVAPWSHSTVQNRSIERPKHHVSTACDAGQARRNGHVAAGALGAPGVVATA